MKSKELDRLATGPNPASRVDLPGKGERCPRCHGSGRDKPCALCAPHLVPADGSAD